MKKKNAAIQLLFFAYDRQIQYKFEDIEEALRSRTFKMTEHTMTKIKCTKKAINDLKPIQ